MSFKKTDYIIIIAVCTLLGMFIVSQYSASRKVNSIVQPENNEILALEVAKYTKVNAELRLDVQDLTRELDQYKNSSLSNADSLKKYENDIKMYKKINGELENTGQGITVIINRPLSTPQLIDLINAIKNIGAQSIAINNTRINLNTDISIFSGRDNYEIKVLGNSELLKSAMERRGGIIEQISNKDMKINVNKNDTMTIGSGSPIIFKYAKIVN